MVALSEGMILGLMELIGWADCRDVMDGLNIVVDVIDKEQSIKK
jgi:hypothetical protein